MVEKIALVIETLTAGGIRAERGYGQREYFYPQSPVAAVNLHSADADSIVLSVAIYSVEAGACENAAWSAMELLGGIGAECSVGSCQFQKHMDLFSLRVLAKWTAAQASEPEATEELSCLVYLNGTKLLYVTGFTASTTAELYRFTDEDGSTEILRNTKVWTLTLEELLPPEVKPEAEAATAFSLAVLRSGGQETYPNCYWETMRRTETPEGVRQVRIAKSWSDRTIV